MKTYNTNDRPTDKITKLRFFVYPTESMYKKGWNLENCKVYYDVDIFDRTIIFEFKSKYDYEAKVIRWNQYSDHRGGSFTVSEKQYNSFKRAYKRVRSLAYKIEEID